MLVMLFWLCIVCFCIPVYIGFVVVLFGSWSFCKKKLVVGVPILPKGWGILY